MLPFRRIIFLKGGSDSLLFGIGIIAHSLIASITGLVSLLYRGYDLSKPQPFAQDIDILIFVYSSMYTKCTVHFEQCGQK
ncbi:hypothetical protein GLOIN_2v1520828 [Rhizophagus irregularis DAOM 181602=DAOM 197198]|uniref:Uncharacterized protein n=1 Tax=Rhizophagus irregularis (strain DAOM 181602 / DAOM 197198 / MUCL 43194) TaxID=747089 RepID=A0A2P4QQU1_RHIID|nr:hypothetical protein GLOIN_2v1520828 [Rhizophagus irregularis DAOM 181602=DAOM 197198]POG80027.1 hypothetical protein GLOIN_2v1520828 [Rhizophagus irregularis DAOM 181602=DAOM 197198]|eukprot:XP_025186893.1 hypothetical protein GLOIN_2v1520828 [Rhizophagus irregularis DAOM 181602=DAOM 197198]